MTKEEWDRIEKSQKVSFLPDIDSKRQHYDANKRKEKEEGYSFVLNGSPPPPHVRAAYKSFKKPQFF